MAFTKTISDLVIKRETDRAYMISKGGKDAWIPKSQVKDLEFDEEVRDQYGKLNNAKVVFIELPAWLADKDNVKDMV